MTDDEVDELLKVVDTSSGEINYTGLSFPTLSFLSVRLMMLIMVINGQTSSGLSSQTNRVLYTPALPWLRPD